MWITNFHVNLVSCEASPTISKCRLRKTFHAQHEYLAQACKWWHLPCNHHLHHLWWCCMWVCSCVTSSALLVSGCLSNYLDFKVKKNLFPGKDCTWRVAEPSWKPTNHVTNTKKRAFNLSLKNVFQNCLKSKFSYRSPTWNNGTVVPFQCETSSVQRKINPLANHS